MSKCWPLLSIKELRNIRNIINKNCSLESKLSFNKNKEQGRSVFQTTTCAEGLLEASLTNKGENK